MCHGKMGVCDQREEGAWEIWMAAAAARWAFNTYSRAWPEPCKHAMGVFFLFLPVTLMSLTRQVK